MSEKEGFWCPTLIDSWRAFLRQGIADDGTLQHRNAFISNIGYNLQFMEFSNYQILEVHLHATVYTQTMKSFVVTGMGIVEALMWYLLKKNNLNRKVDWEKIAELQTSTYKDSEAEFRIVNFIEKKLEKSKEVEMSLQWMLKKVENKKLLGVDSQVYRDLNYLRALRNKVHIHIVQHDADTDWNAFNDNEFKLMKKALYGVFTSELFKPKKKHLEKLSFLEVEERTEELVGDIPL